MLEVANGQGDNALTQHKDFIVPCSCFHGMGCQMFLLKLLLGQAKTWGFKKQSSSYFWTLDYSVECIMVSQGCYLAIVSEGAVLRTSSPMKRGITS